MYYKICLNFFANTEISWCAVDMPEDYETCENLQESAHKAQCGADLDGVVRGGLFAFLSVWVNFGSTKFIHCQGVFLFRYPYVIGHSFRSLTFVIVIENSFRGLQLFFATFFLIHNVAYLAFLIYDTAERPFEEVKMSANIAKIGCSIDIALH